MNARNKALVIKFLKKKKILTSFKKRVMAHHGDNLDKYLETLNHESTIGAAFLWQYQPEGSSYWIDMEREFVKFFEKENQPQLPKLRVV